MSKQISVGVLLGLDKEVSSIPKDIEVIADYGPVGIVIGEMQGFFTGNHVIVKGDQSKVEDWLCSIGKVWLQTPGTPAMAQQFQEWEFK